MKKGIIGKREPRRQSAIAFARVGGLAAVVAFGCGGAQPPAAPASAHTAPAKPSPEASELTLAVVVQGEPSPLAASCADSLRSSLVASGYKVAGAPGAPHDVVLIVRVSATEERSMFAVEVNGRRDVKERVHLTATVIAGGTMLEEHAADFIVQNGVVGPEQVVAVVSGLSASPKLTAYGRELHAAAEARERAKQEKVAEAKSREDEQERKSARIAEETEWKFVGVMGCRLPTALTGCDAVRLFLAKYPEGAHAEEGRAALAASVPAMEKIQKDENAWKKADVASCRVAKTHEACAGVEIYKTKFADGVHLDEAQSLLREVP